MVPISKRIMRSRGNSRQETKIPEFTPANVYDISDY